MAITNPLKGDAPFPMDAAGLHQSFANTLPRALSYDAWRQFDSRNVLRDCMGDTGKIDTETPHEPLVFIGADKDQIIPAGSCEKNAKAYDDKESQVSYREFKNRSHFICGESGGEDGAGYIAQWIDLHSTAQAARRVS